MPTSGEKLYRMRRTLSVLSPGYASRRSAGFAGAVSAASGLMPGCRGRSPLHKITLISPFPLGRALCERGSGGYPSPSGKGAEKKEKAV